MTVQVLVVAGTANWVSAFCHRERLPRSAVRMLRSPSDAQGYRADMPDSPRVVEPAGYLPEVLRTVDIRAELRIRGFAIEQVDPLRDA